MVLIQTQPMQLSVKVKYHSLCQGIDSTSLITFVSLAECGMHTCFRILENSSLIVVVKVESEIILGLFNTY